MCLTQVSTIDKATGISHLFASPFSPLFGKELKDKNVFYFFLYPKNLTHSRCSKNVYERNCAIQAHPLYFILKPPRCLLPSKTSFSMDAPSDVSGG